MITFFVQGDPQTQGSKRPFVNPRTGRAVLVEQAGAKLKCWRSQIADAALDAMDGRELLSGAVELSVAFHFVRPKGHFKTNGALRASAPASKITRPDLDKLIRAVKDSLSGVVYRDDSQVVSLLAQKWFRPAPGVRITITETV